MKGDKNQDFSSAVEHNSIQRKRRMQDQADLAKTPDMKNSTLDQEMVYDIC